MTLLLLLASFAAAASDTEAFSSGELAVRGGGLLPLGSLADHYDPAPRVGASLVLSHWGEVKSRVDLAVARLPGQVPMDFVFAAAGFDWRPDFPVETGISLALFRVSTVDPDPAVPRTVDGAETEFGIALRAGVPFWRRGDWSARFEGQWELAFTRPEASAFAWAGLSLSRRLW